MKYKSNAMTGMAGKMSGYGKGAFKYVKPMKLAKVKSAGPGVKWAKRAGPGMKWAKKPGMGKMVKQTDVWWV
jgi:hypothetical protein